ncbi:unnamed protein product [Prorocentrum cordatum]|uniref:Uncharacterized protein n=1 Tax=Prorocentrum cordatum TaxID=2364126 RepID=A0ABN9TGK7_9DINO|nr:unnamed protein product [Polarella glacialis]
MGISSRLAPPPPCSPPTVAFLRLPHLAWDVRVAGAAGRATPAGSPRAASVVVCTLRAGAAAALAETPRVVAEECGDEESRRRYAEALRPFLRGLRRDLGRPAPEPLTVWTWAGATALLAAWLLAPEVAGGRPCAVTLMEENPELAGRAAARLNAGAGGGSERAQIVAHAGPDRRRASGDRGGAALS